MSITSKQWYIGLLTLLGALLPLPVAVKAQQAIRSDIAVDLPATQTRYYVIYSDVEGDELREVAIRMTKMVEEYHDRTREFSGTIRTRLPFYLFRKPEDYYAAGGLDGSAGVFTGDRLMAVAGSHLTAATWHVVQHEGFHQFAAAVIGGDLPIWVNEGLAEYFGEGIFTGDGFVTGLIPAWRQARIRKTLEAHQFRSLPEMMLLSHETWNSNLSINNYDQAWSMVQFLAHGENGKYQKAFSGFMVSLGRGTPWRQAWMDEFGDANGFEEKWRDYWLNLPANPTLDLYTRAFGSTLGSFLARAYSQKQTFDTFEEFQAAIADEKIKYHPEDWLPPRLAIDAMKVSLKLGTWSIDSKSRPPRLLCQMEDGSLLTVRFTLAAGRVASVSSELDDLPRALVDAKALVSAGHVQQARKLVQECLNRNPHSSAAIEARKFLVDAH